MADRPDDTGDNLKRDVYLAYRHWSAQLGRLAVLCPWCERPIADAAAILMPWRIPGWLAMVQMDGPQHLERLFTTLRSYV